MKNSCVARVLFASLAGVTLAATAPASALMPDALEQAISCSKKYKDLPASFTLTYAPSAASPVAARYDVETDQWTMVFGDPDALDREAADGFAGIKDEVGKRGGLVPQDVFATLNDLVLLEETEAFLVYSFTPGPDEDGDPMPEAMIEALDRRFVIDRASMCMSGMSMMSTMPFKPASVAKVDEFEFTYEFSQPEASPIPLLSTFRTRAKGSAMFQQFDDSVVVSISDVVIAE